MPALFDKAQNRREALLVSAPKIKPVRLQRKRAKGFRLESPNGLPIVYVGRPSKYGNPFRAENFDYEFPETKRRSPLSAQEDAVEAFREWLESHPHLEEIKLELRGRNLACWCSLDQPCHADVLLEVANR